MSETQQAGGSAVTGPNESTDRRLIAIFLIVLIDVLGLTIILPLLPFYEYGPSPSDESLRRENPYGDRA